MCERLSCTAGRRKYGQQRLDSHAARRRWTHLARKHNRSEGALRRVVAHRDRRAASRHGPRRDRHDEGTRAREQKSEQEPQHRASRNPARNFGMRGHSADDFNTTGGNTLSTQKAKFGEASNRPGAKTARRRGASQFASRANNGREQSPAASCCRCCGRSLCRLVAAAACCSGAVLLWGCWRWVS